MIDAVRAVSYIYLFAHMMQPLFVAAYLSEKNTENTEWCYFLLSIVMSIVFFFFIFSCNHESTLLIRNSPFVYVFKLLFLVGHIVGIICAYFFPKDFPDPDTRDLLRRMPKYQKAFIYGIIGNVILYGWWGPGLIEVAIWVTIITMVIFSGCIISKQKKIIILQMQTNQNKVKLNKKKKIITNCKLRTGIMAIILLGFVTYGLVRAYFLFTISISTC